jgi:hypothetical protein
MLLFSSAKRENLSLRSVARTRTRNAKRCYHSHSHSHSTRRRRWRGTRARCGQLDVFQLAAELLDLFLENLDLGFDFGIEVLASYVRQKKNGSRADNQSEQERHERSHGSDTLGRIRQKASDPLFKNQGANCCFATISSTFEEYLQPTTLLPW